MDTTNVKTRGGARPGAGHPHSEPGTRQHLVHLPQDVWDYLRKEGNASLSITRLVRSEKSAASQYEEPIKVTITKQNQVGFGWSIHLPDDIEDVLKERPTSPIFIGTANQVMSDMRSSQKYQESLDNPNHYSINYAWFIWYKRGWRRLSEMSPNPHDLLFLDKIEVELE